MKTKIVILLILFLSFFCVHFYGNNIYFEVPEINKIIPHKIGDWLGKDYKATENAYRMIPPNEMLLRNYENTKTGQIINLVIVLTNKRDHIHTPDLCNSGRGFDFKNEKKIYISKNTYINYVPGLKNSKHELYYWYTDLKDIFTDRVKFMRHMSVLRFLNKPIKGYGYVIIINEVNKKNINFIQKVDNLLRTR